MTVDVLQLSSLIGQPLQVVLLVLLLVYVWRLDRSVLLLKLRLDVMSGVCPLFHKEHKGKGE